MKYFVEQKIFSDNFNFFYVKQSAIIHSNIDNQREDVGRGCLEPCEGSGKK